MKKAQVPFTPVPNSLLEDGTLHSSVKVLYLLILKYANKEGVCYAAQKLLAEHMNLSDRQIKKLVKILKERSLIRIERAPGLKAVNYSIPLVTIEGNSTSPYTGTIYHSQRGLPVPIKSKSLKSKNEKKGGMTAIAEIVQKRQQE